MTSPIPDPSIRGTVVYRRAKGADGSPAGHSRRGRTLESKARVVCGRCNSGWMSRTEESVRSFLAPLISRREVALTADNPWSLATWAVKTMLLLQHTHRRADQIIIPSRDYTDLFAARVPSPLMIVLTACAEPPGRGSGIEATVGYLDENRDMAGIATLVESDGSGDLVDMHAYTVTLRIGYWIGHVLRIGSRSHRRPGSRSGPVRVRADDLASPG